MFFLIAVIFVIINLMAIFTTKKILESLYEIFVNSVQYFLYKKSDLELYGLTDFENLFNSSYNFYNQYFTDISNNEVDFDLMMFGILLVLYFMNVVILLEHQLPFFY